MINRTFGKQIHIKSFTIQPSTELPVDKIREF